MILSAFNLNIEIVAPECISPNVGLREKFWATMLFPIAVAFILFLVYILKFIYKALIKGVKGEERNRHLPTMVSALIVLARITYLMVTRSAFVPMNCTPT